MKTFDDYEEARKFALKRAKQLNMDVGIEAVKEFGHKRFSVIGLPREENRQGYELRVEVVKPTDF